MEVEADVCFQLFALADVVRHEHELVTVDPDGLRVDQLADLVHPSCNSGVDSLEFGPVIDDRSLEMVASVHEIVHIGPHQTLIEPQVWRYLFLCEVDGVALLLSEYFGRHFFL